VQQIQRIDFGHHFALKDQIHRAALSITLNIAEGFGRRSDREFSHFLNMAHGSASEVKAALYSARDACLISAAEFDALYRAADDVGKMTFGLSIVSQIFA
jgi:four helix bundle protein